MTAKVFPAFEKVVDRDVYEAVPDDWFVGLTDIVDSSHAIAASRYKAVNTTGVAIIAAIRNALPDATRAIRHRLSMTVICIFSMAPAGDMRRWRGK
jgi:hypothetical protein